MTQFSQTYPTDLQQSEWLRIQEFWPLDQRGRPCPWERWQIIHAIVQVRRTGGQWRMLPTTFPPWQPGQGYFRRWTRSGRWYRLKVALVQPVRMRHPRAAQPSAALLASQRVKPSAGGEARGSAVQKQTPGRKRHSVVDPVGWLRRVVVQSARLQEGSGGPLVWQTLCELLKRNLHHRCGRLQRIWAAAAQADILPLLRKQSGWTLDLVRRPPAQKGWPVQPHRWLVARTFGWLGRYRRVARDSEPTGAASEAMTCLASTRRMLNLLST